MTGIGFTNSLLAVPVSVITVNAALLGTAIYGLHQASGQGLPMNRNGMTAAPAASLHGVNGNPRIPQHEGVERCS